MGPLGRPTAAIDLSETERETLERWARRPKSAQALALRCRIVLLAAEGKANNEIALELSCNRNTVGKWRRRFADARLDGLQDEPRPGKPRTITDADVERVLVKTLEEAPRDATHWSTRSMAQASGLSQTAVSRIWRAFGLKPQLTEHFKLSTDPEFIDKVRDIVGLYLNPPDAAVILCVDEKSQIQALDRTAPILPYEVHRQEVVAVGWHPPPHGPSLPARGRGCIRPAPPVGVLARSHHPHQHYFMRHPSAS